MSNTQEEIKLKDVIHFYTGCEVVVNNDDPKLRRVRTFAGFHDYPTCLQAKTMDRIGGVGTVNLFLLKPILRPLSDMTEEEVKEFFKLPDGAIVYKKTEYDNHISFAYKWNDPEIKPNTSDKMCHSEVAMGKNKGDYNSRQFIYLLSKRFDLFELIPSGQALDKTNQ